MLVQSPVAGDSRVIREATTLAAGGYDVRVVGRAVPEGFAPPAGVIVASVGPSRGLRPDRARPERDRLALRVARWLLLPEHRARVEKAWIRGAGALVAAHPPADIVHAHDFNTLQLGATLAHRWNAALVYDSHELWFGRALSGRPTPLRNMRAAALERRLARRARLGLTVSSGIADRLRSYGLKDVRLVRNTFPQVQLPAAKGADRPQGLVYAGRIGTGRDLETVVDAAPRLTSLRTVLVGPTEPGYRLPRVGIIDVRPATSLEDVDQIYRDFGIALVPLSGNCENHQLALPNKLFHAVHAGVPVVAADLPAIREVVIGHRLGVLFRPGDARSLVDAVAAVVSAYSEYVRNVRAAQSVLSWEVDGQVLMDAYREIGKVKQ